MSSLRVWLAKQSIEDRHVASFSPRNDSKEHEIRDN